MLERTVLVFPACGRNLLGLAPKTLVDIKFKLPHVLVVDEGSSWAELLC